MKTVFKTGAAVVLVMLLSSLRTTVYAQPEGEVTYQEFYDELSPYGRWIDYPDYGYVWCPDTGPDFRPYSTNGHWVWSDEYEWIWVSDYDWGWAPFHYGRWFDDPMYGWLWVPGYEWSPAWVTWRTGGDYYGWAPLMPGISIGINFSIGRYAPPVDYWCFAPRQYITSPRLYGYCLPRRQNVTIINQTTIINNYQYGRNGFMTGPGRSEVERYTHQRIQPVVFRETNRPGRTAFRNNEINMYRPRIERQDNLAGAPRRFENYEGNDRVNNRNFQRDPSGQNDRGWQGRPDIGQSQRQADPRGNGGTDLRGNGGSQIRPDNGQPQRQFDQRGGNDGLDWRNRPNPHYGEQPQPDRGWQGQDNRPSFNRDVRPQPAPQQQDPYRFRNQRIMNENPSGGNLRSFENRNFNQPQPQPQRQFSPDMGRREQPVPRQVEPRGGSGGGFSRGNEGGGGFNRGGNGGGGGDRGHGHRG
ncbi:MAG TPA: DUF6600 domain-containing protein [Chitinophagaceae bacterium]|nr:DUF6600 domain-containing protein [Chitinophagaceae bacterium]